FGFLAALTNAFGAGRNAFSPDGKLLATASFSLMPANGTNTLAFWDLATRQKIEKLSQAGPDAGSLAFSTDGRLVAIGYTDGWVRLWDVRNDQKLGEFRKTSDTIWEVALSANSRLLASTAAEKVVLYDVVAKRVSRMLEAHTGEVKCVRFAPDGKSLAS